MSIAFNFCGRTLKWGSFGFTFVWSPQKVSTALMLKDEAKPSSICKDIIWKQILYPLAQQLPCIFKGLIKLEARQGVLQRKLSVCRIPLPTSQGKGCGARGWGFKRTTGSGVPALEGHSGGLGVTRSLQAEEKQPLQRNRDSGERCNCTPANGKVTGRRSVGPGDQVPN